MARKRGGIAGFYDSHKGAIKALAPMALGLIPGAGVPLAVAAGAALGADREGKGYFKGLASREGLAGAALGGVTGYAGGKLGESAAQGIRGMLTAQKLNALQPVDMASKIGMTPGTTSSFVPQAIAPESLASQVTSGSPSFLKAAPETAAKKAIAAPRVSAPTARVTSPLVNQPGPLNRFADLQTINRSMGASPNPSDVLRNAPGKFGRFAEKLRKNKDIIEMGTKGLQLALPNAESDAALMRAETERMRFEEERRMVQMEEERRRQIAYLLMPMARQNFPQYYGG